MLLPGLEPGDEIEFLPDDVAGSEFECALTFENATTFDARNFWRERLLSNEKGRRPKKRSHAMKTLEEAVECIPEKPNHLRVVQCGHQFLDAPFFYHIMTSQFRCPICRSGSSSAVELNEHSETGMDKDVWGTMCKITKLCRDRLKMEEAVEEMQQVIELQMNEVQSINRMSVDELLTGIEITIIFSVYSAAPQMQNSHRAVIPTASVTVGLRPNFASSFAADESVDGNNTPMVYESGQAQRPLSMILRNSTAFSFTLFAQTVDGEFAFFQSGMLRIPSAAQITTTLDDVVVCTSDLNGKVVMRWEKGTDNCQLLRGIRYETDLANARRIRLQTLNGFSF